MRNLALAVMIVVGLVNIDQIYYNGEMLRPVYTLVWIHVHGLLAA